MVGVKIMNHYITPDNQIWGFDESQTNLIPKNAVLIPNIYSIAQIPYITLVNEILTFNQEKYNADIAEEIAKQQAQVIAKQSAMAKLAALGLTQDEVKALLG